MERKGKSFWRVQCWLWWVSLGIRRTLLVNTLYEVRALSNFFLQLARISSDLNSTLCMVDRSSWIIEEWINFVWDRRTPLPTRNYLLSRIREWTAIETGYYEEDWGTGWRIDSRSSSCSIDQRYATTLLPLSPLCEVLTSLSRSTILMISRFVPSFENRSGTKRFLYHVRTCRTHVQEQSRDHS